MCSNRLASFIIAPLVVLLCGTTHIFAQTEETEEIFQNNKITLGDNGERDTIYLLEPVTGDTAIKILPIMYPFKVNGVPTKAEQSSFPLSILMREKIAAEICSGRFFKSKSDSKPLPDGLIKLGLTNIVLSPNGSVVYYTMYKADFYMQEEGISRKINMESVIVSIFNENTRLFRHKSKEQYLVLNGTITSMTFSVHNGTIELVK